jgi:hypothetical protein
MCNNNFYCTKKFTYFRTQCWKIFKKVRKFIDEIKNEIDTEERFEELKKIEKEISKRTKKL